VKVGVEGIGGDVIKNHPDASGVLDRQALVNASVSRRGSAAFANYDLARDLCGIEDGLDPVRRIHVGVREALTQGIGIGTRPTARPRENNRNGPDSSRE
jgi:hypothetical protein